ncbi:MAG TPA: tyrosine-type recombinase/integrase [Pirellulaceae bacterium]|jgi:integrase|nr:tyrosine-type recombinase/integrase [Pirellulaceae bacterium]
MPHYPKPFFRPKRGLWYVQLEGKQHNLGPDREAAFTAYHELMSRPAPKPMRADAVVLIVDDYLEWCQRNRAPDTYRWYLDRLQAFVKTIDPALTVGELKPFHVQRWVDSRTDWAKGSRRNAIASVKRVFRWAQEQGYIEVNPIALMKKPACGKKEQVVSEAEYAAILAEVRDQAFTDLLAVTWDTGCRPQESLRVTASQVDLVNQRWVIPTTPGKPDNRVVYMTDAAMVIVKRRMAQFPTGPIFRNTDGVAWTTDAVGCRFHRMLTKLKVRYSLYALRHTWITRMLQSGVDSLTVAFLAGHKDPSMLAKHYAHLTLNPQHLLQQAKKLSA